MQSRSTYKQNTNTKNSSYFFFGILFVLTVVIAVILFFTLDFDGKKTENESDEKKSETAEVQRDVEGQRDLESYTKKQLGKALLNCQEQLKKIREEEAIQVDRLSLEKKMAGQEEPEHKFALLQVGSALKKWWKGRHEYVEQTMIHNVEARLIEIRTRIELLEDNRDDLEKRIATYDEKKIRKLERENESLKNKIESQTTDAD